MTDAISGAGLGPGEYRLGSRRVVVDENLATWSADRSHLVGSAGTMRRAAENLQGELGLSAGQIRILTVENPARIWESTRNRRFEAISNNVLRGTAAAHRRSEISVD